MPLLAQSSLKRARRHLRASLVGGLAAVLVSSTTADAAGMIRDAETEALIRTGQLEKAEEKFNEVLKRDPKNVAALVWLGTGPAVRSTPE